jgi:ElaB/YqjD/DUF883 family membrane-anchored ribosome-binding protein
MANANAYENQSTAGFTHKELRDVLTSTEALLAALGDERSDAVNELRDRLTNTIADVKRELGPSVLASARETIYKARDTAVSVDSFVNERPWTSVGIGIGVGVLLGMILKD